MSYKLNIGGTLFTPSEIKENVENKKNIDFGILFGGRKINLQKDGKNHWMPMNKILRSIEKEVKKKEVPESDKLAFNNMLDSLQKADKSSYKEVSGFKWITAQFSKAFGAVFRWGIVNRDALINGLYQKINPTNQSAVQAEKLLTEYKFNPEMALPTGKASEAFNQAVALLHKAKAEYQAVGNEDAEAAAGAKEADILAVLGKHAEAAELYDSLAVKFESRKMFHDAAKQYLLAAREYKADGKTDLAITKYNKAAELFDKAGYKGEAQGARLSADVTKKAEAK